MSEPHKTLGILASKNITGTDAATSLDTFCLRVGANLAAETKGMTAEQRDLLLVRRFGSDAVRVAAVLMDPYGPASPEWTDAL